MSFRTTYILFGLLGAMVLVFGLALWLAPPVHIDEKYLLPSVHDPRTKVINNDVLAVEISRPTDGVELVFRRPNKDADFVLEKPAGFRINADSVLTLITDILRAEAVPGEVKGDLKKYGLDKPHGFIKLTTSDPKRDLTIHLGESEEDRIYVTSSDVPKKPRIMDRSQVEGVFKPLDDFRARKLLQPRTADITRVEVKRPADPKDAVELVKDDLSWRYLKPEDYGAAEAEGATATGAEAKGLSGVRAILDALGALEADGKTDDKDKKDKDKEKKDAKKDRKKELGFFEDRSENLDKYGLETEAKANMVLTVTETKEVPKEDGSKEKEKATKTYTILIGKEVDKTDLYYARLGSETHVVTLPKKLVEPFTQLLANKEALRDRNLVALKDKPDVVSIRYPNGETIWLFRSEGKGFHGADFHGGMGGGADAWKLFRGDTKKSEATDSAAVKKMLDVVMAPRPVKEFPKKGDAALGLDDKNNLVVSMWTNGIKKEEKKEPEKDKKDDEKKAPAEERPGLARTTPDIEVVFGRTDSKNLVAVLRKSGKELKQADALKVSEEILKSAREDWLSYLDKAVPPLFANRDTVNKITISLDGKETVIERKKPDDTASDWVFRKPSEWDGRRVDGGLLSEKVFGPLGNLRAKAWESLKPTAEQLGRWGLTDTKSKITLDMKVDNKPQSVSLLIGNPTDDKTGYHAKKSDDDRVFILDKAAVDELKSPLLDLKILDFPVASLKSLKLTVRDALGERKLEFERKSGATAGWEPKGVTAKPNLKNLDLLAETLAGLRAKKFVAFKATPTEAQGLDTAKAGPALIEIEVSDKDGKETKKMTLVVGAADGDGFYALSDQAKGDIFVIDKGPDKIFELVKDLKNLVTN